MLSRKKLALASSIVALTALMFSFQNFDFSVDQSMSHTNRVVRVEQRTVTVDGNPQQASFACPYVEVAKMYDACKITVFRPVDSDGRVIPRPLLIQQKKGLTDYEYTELGLEVKPFSTNNNYLELASLPNNKMYSRVLVMGSAPVAGVLKLMSRNGTVLTSNGASSIRKTGVDLTWEFVLPTSLRGADLEGARVILESGRLYLQGIEAR